MESLKAARDKVNSSMKDIIHGAEGYKVGQTEAASDLTRLTVNSSEWVNCIVITVLLLLSYF